MRIKGSYSEGGRIRIDKDVLDGASIQHRVKGEWTKGKLYVRSAKDSVVTNARFMGIEHTYGHILHVTNGYVEIRLSIHVVGASLTSGRTVYKGSSTTTLRLNRSASK